MADILDKAFPYDIVGKPRNRPTAQPKAMIWSSTGNLSYLGSCRVTHLGLDTSIVVGS